MNNYEYIIAGLPVITLENRSFTKSDYDSCLSFIKSQLSASDLKDFELFLDGFNGDKLCEDFYKEALKNGNSFIREYFRYDLWLRNAKVKYLNKALGREALQDIFWDLEADEDELNEISKALSTQALLDREKALDDLLWNKISALVLFNYLDFDVILAFIAKLQIILRWTSLDPERGKDLFPMLIKEVRGTYKKVEFKDN